MTHELDEQHRCWNAWCVCDHDQPEDDETNQTATRHADVTGHAWSEAPPEGLGSGEKVIARVYAFDEGEADNR